MSDQKFECVVSAELVRRALFGVSTEEARYYLNGVHISPAPEGGAVITATDGHLLISLHDPEGVVSGEGIIGLSKQMKLALKVTGILLEKRLLLVRAKNCVGRAFVADIATKGEGDDYSPYTAARDVFEEPDRRVQAAQFGPLLIDGTYPDWRRVIPTDLRPAAPVPVLDQRLVARMAEALAPDPKRRRLHFTASGQQTDSAPVLVTSPDFGAPAGLGVIMPMRVDVKTAVVPTWAQKAAALAAE